MQRQEMKDVGKLEGFNVRLINEPTCAATAVAHEDAMKSIKLSRNDHHEMNYLVFDIGGGTTDITLLNHNVRSKFTSFLVFFFYNIQVTFILLLLPEERDIVVVVNWIKS